MTNAATSSWDERHAAGVGVLGEMLGRANAEQYYQAAITNYGAVAAWGIDYVFGEIWTRPVLARRDRSMVLIAVLAALGRNEELEIHVGAAVRNGLSGAEIHDVFHVMLVYAGYPTTLNALRIAKPVLAQLGQGEPAPPPERKDGERRADDAREAAASVFGVDAADARAAFVEQYGAVGEIAFDFGLGEVWSSKGLPPHDRLLVEVGVLAAVGAPRLLAEAGRAARAHGATDAELEEIMVMVSAYAGLGRAVEALAALGLPAS